MQFWKNYGVQREAGNRIEGDNRYYAADTQISSSNYKPFQMQLTDCFPGDIMYCTMAQGIKNMDDVRIRNDQQYPHHQTRAYSKTRYSRTVILWKKTEQNWPI